MKRKWLIVGKKNSGKTKLADYIERTREENRYSLDLHYRDNTIEVPSEYLEVNYLNHAIIMISQNQALANLFLIATDDISIYPPDFSRAFTRPCATIITKIDLVSKSWLKEVYKEALKIGSEYIFKLSFKTGEGLDELEKYIKEIGGASEIYNRR